MTAQTAIPLKWYVPFAQNDSSRVEIPVTTSDATRASQSLGFPPLTMQPPESGGVPPQGEDFNGGMNQVARVCWWVLNGGGWPYDAAFATNSNINGYPNGAKLQAADFAGDWLNTIDNNQSNPDTTGTNWVPGYVYGAYALTGQTGGTTTLAPSAAKFKNITITGTLTSALTIVLPVWLYDWTITNNTTGAFVTIVKTLAGSGVTIPQNGSPTRVTGDGTNITQPAANIPPATASQHAVQLGQVSGVVGSVRNAKMAVAAASSSASWLADELIVETALGGLRYCIGSPSGTINLATTGAGGMDAGSAPVSGFVAIYGIYNPTSKVFNLLAANCTNITPPSIYSMQWSAMPAGYTASALIGIWATNASGQLTAGILHDRIVRFPGYTVLNVSVSASSYTSTSVAAAVPLGATRVMGLQSVQSSTSPTGCTSIVASDANGSGGVPFSNAASTPYVQGYFDVEIMTAQTIYRIATVGAGTPTNNITVVGYSF